MSDEKNGRRHLTPAEGRRVRINLLRVAGLAIVLGLLMEGILVVGGQEAATLTNMLDKGLWPFLVCMALAVGQTVADGWPGRAGLFALISTPIAFTLGKAVQKSLSGMLDHTATGVLVDGSLLTEAGLRGVEYAALAIGLTWLRRKHWAGALAHLALGAVVGAMFGLVISIFVVPSSLIGWVVKEIVFPTGCALIIFVSETLAELLPEDEALANTAQSL
jgi:hypothetical protein